MQATLADGWFWPRAPHISPADGRHNAQVLAQLDLLDFRPNPDYPRHLYAVVSLKDIFKRVLVPLSYLYEDDALGLCVANCNLKTLLDRDETTRCLVYRMDGGQVRDRTLNKGLIPQLFQGRSSAGAESYPGDRAFHDPEIPTLQVHTLRLREGETISEGVPAVAIRLGHHEAILVQDE
jgi:hypothetical protein